MENTGQYRFILRRINSPKLIFIMQNSSYADDIQNNGDQTIPNCIKISQGIYNDQTKKHEKFNGIEVANLFPYKSSDGKTALSNFIGSSDYEKAQEANYLILKQIINEIDENNDRIVITWGKEGQESCKLLKEKFLKIITDSKKEFPFYELGIKDMQKIIDYDDKSEEELNEIANPSYPRHPMPSAWCKFGGIENATLKPMNPERKIEIIGAE